MRRRRVAVGTVAGLVALLVGARVELFVARRHVVHLLEEEAAAQAGLSSARASVSSARAERDAADVRVAIARGEMDRANALLAGAGLDRQTLVTTERDASEWLQGVERQSASTQRRVDQLDASVHEAKRCINDGLNSLTAAASGTLGAPAGSACQAASSSGAPASEAPPG